MNSFGNRWLLGLAALLATIKFMLLPWLDHQAEHVERLEVLTQQLDRSVGVIANRQSIIKAVEQVESSTVAARLRFPDVSDPQGFRLTVQQGIGGAAAQASVNVRVFEWIVDGEVKPARLAFSRARVQMDGGFRSLASFQASLEGEYPNMTVREINLSAPAMIGAPNESSASLTIVADFFFRPVASEPAK
jgi:hypothetical protein